MVSILIVPKNISIDAICRTMKVSGDYYYIDSKINQTYLRINKVTRQVTHKGYNRIVENMIAKGHVLEVPLMLNIHTTNCY